MKVRVHVTPQSHLRHLVSVFSLVRDLGACVLDQCLEGRGHLVAIATHNVATNDEMETDSDINIDSYTYTDAMHHLD